MNIIDNHSLLTTHQEQILRQSASLPFNLGKYSSLDDILTKLDVDVIIEPGINVIADHSPKRIELLESILKHWKEELQRLLKKLNEGDNEDLMQKIEEVKKKIKRIEEEMKHVRKALIRGYYNPKDNNIYLFPEEMKYEATYREICIDLLLVTTFAHETMHAYFNRPGHKYPYAYFVEEPLAELGMLLYLHETRSKFYSCAYHDVSSKNNCYRFGAILMNQLQMNSHFSSPTRTYLEGYMNGINKNSMLSLTSTIYGDIIILPKIKTGFNPRNFYTINGKDFYTVYEVLEEFIKLRLRARKSIPDINVEIQNYAGGKPGCVYISDNRSIPVEREMRNGLPNYGEFIDSGLTIRYMKEWKDNNGGNFRKFRERVRKAYSGFFEIDRFK